MKPSELRKLISEYKTLKSKQTNSYDHRTQKRLKEIERRYYHETGTSLVIK